MAASIGFLRTSDWGAGFLAQVTIVADAALDGWTLAFDAAFNIDSIWGAELVSAANGRYVVRATPWNATTPAGGTVSFGFSASGPGSSLDPTGFSLGGEVSAPTPPVISVGDVAVLEGGGFAAFDVVLSAPAGEAVTVDFATADGSARAGQDYQAITGSLTFAAGETRKQVLVPLLDDRVIEANESFGLSLRNAAGATLGAGDGVAAITDDDSPRLVVSDARIVEGVAGRVTMTFTVSLSEPSASRVSVGFTTADGTAVAGADYTARSGTIAFAAGETEKRVTVAILNDKLAETDETVILRLVDPVRAVIADGAGVGTIEDSPLPRISVSDASIVEGVSGRIAMNYTVSLSQAATVPVTVRFKTQDGTATAGLDYTARSGAITFAAGETEKVVAISVLSDRLVEADESVLLRLSDPVRAVIADAEAVGTIIDLPVPRITIADASLVEGDSGRATMSFRVSLSEPSSSKVTVNFATADGTAIAGQDYTALSGTLSFAAGETEKVLAISILGDKVAETDETLFLRLSDPLRAVIADAEAVGTIAGNDLPRISIGDATLVTEGDPGGAGMLGVLSTRGGDIVDETGAAVKIAAVNWFGLETSTFAPHGLNVRNWKEMMQQMADTGFNAIRLPFSAQAVLDGGTPGDINWHLNPDLVGLSPLQIIDAIIDYAGEIGLRIILDHHRSSAGNGPNSNGLWHEGGYTMARWVEMWEDLAARYAGNPTVIGADLSNEPHGATWNAWASAAEVAGNAIQAVNPDWLIIVEGVAQHEGQHYWWGGNLMGAEDRPVVLNEPNKLVYSAHDYPNSIWPQPFFQGPDFPANMPAVFDKMWGYLWADGIAPVFIGEFGTRMEDAKDIAWLDKLVAYLGGDTDADGDKDVAGPGVSFSWWSWNPNSGDTGGILADDWTTVLTEKVEKLEAILPDATEPLRQAFFEVTLDAPVSREVTVGWRSVAGTATEADYVAASGVLTFAPGDTSETIAVTLRGDDLAEATEGFVIELFDVTGGVIADGSAIGRIADDDWAL